MLTEVHTDSPGPVIESTFSIKYNSGDGIKEGEIGRAHDRDENYTQSEKKMANNYLREIAIDETIICVFKFTLKI
jgi:hypothetical protein